MPKKNGYQVLAQIRRNDPLLPVIFLSARGSPADVALGLDLGSDDYIPKPFDNEVLLSRINAVFRRVSAHAPVQDTPGEAGFAMGTHWVDAGRPCHGWSLCTDVKSTAVLAAVLLKYIHHLHRYCRICNKQTLPFYFRRSL